MSITFKDTDQFILHDPTDNNHYKVSHIALKESFVPGNARQVDESNGDFGKVGLMKPSEKFIYDEDSGLLDIVFPNSFHFVGVIFEDYQIPNLNHDHLQGDFYYVEPSDGSSSVTIDPNDWPGLDNATLSYVIENRGSGYRPLTGLYHSFGDASNTNGETVYNTNTNNGASKDAVFDLNINGGVVVGFTIANGGNGYEVDDILELSNDTSQTSAYIKVVNVDSGSQSITDAILVASDNESGGGGGEADFAGDIFHLPATSGYVGKLYSLLVTPDSKSASGSKVDCDIVGGEITNVIYSRSSNHEVKDRRFSVIHPTSYTGSTQATVKVTLTSPTQDLVLNWGDKLVLDGSGVWHVISDTLSEEAILDIVGLQGITDEHFNNDQAIDATRRDVINRNKLILELKDSFYFLDPNGDISDPQSYSGFLNPYDKLKLDGISELSEPGLIRYLTTETLNDEYDSTDYKAIDLDVTDSVDVPGGIDYEINVNYSSVGKKGAVMVSSDSDVEQNIIEEYMGGGKRSDDYVMMNSRQASQNYTPNNYYVLPSLT